MRGTPKRNNTLPKLPAWCFELLFACWFTYEQYALLKFNGFKLLCWSVTGDAVLINFVPLAGVCAWSLWGRIILALP